MKQILAYPLVYPLMRTHRFIGGVLTSINMDL